MVLFFSGEILKRGVTLVTLWIHSSYCHPAQKKLLKPKVDPSVFPLSWHLLEEGVSLG